GIPFAHAGGYSGKYDESMRSRRSKVILFGSVLLALPVVATMLYAEPQEVPAAVPNPRAGQRVIPQTPYVDDRLEAYDLAVREVLHETGIPGAAIGIIRDSTIICRQGYGVKSKDGIDSVDEHTVFRIGSVSKCFAAVLTA